MAKKKASSSRSSKKTARKAASSASAQSPNSKKKKTTRKKTATGGEASSKKTATARKSSGKKKTAATAAGSGKKTTSKPTSRKKTPSPPKKKAPATTRKTRAGQSTAASAKKKTAGAPSTAAKSTAAASKKKTTTRKTTRKKTTRSRSESSTKIKGRSVAEVASTAQTDAQGYVLINGRRVRMVSLKGVDRTKKKKTTRAAPVETTNTDLPPKQRKTKLSRKDLTYFRTLLLERRRDLVGNLGSMEDEALRSNGGEVSHMPIHMADIGSDTYEQDFMLGLAENERQRLKEIDQALMRIEEGTYGVCMKTGEQIPRPRLEAKPWARYTIEAAREMERTGFNS